MLDIKHEPRHADWQLRILALLGLLLALAPQPVLAAAEPDSVVVAPLVHAFTPT